VNVAKVKVNTAVSKEDKTSDQYDEFCIEIRRESNPRGRKLRSPMVSDQLHVMGTFGTNRRYTVGRVVRV